MFALTQKLTDLATLFVKYGCDVNLRDVSGYA